MIVDVIIPAYNEEQAIGHVINDIPKHLVREIVVVNNNSTDQTASAAVANGAVVVNAPLRGYGNACLQGLKYLRGKSVIPDIVVFIAFLSGSDKPPILWFQKRGYFFRQKLG